MNRSLFKSLAVVAALMVVNPTFGAAFIKFDGVDGEAQTQTEPNRELARPGNQETGLLLPAVQQARESAQPPADNGRQGKKKGYVEYDWKVEEGSQ